MVGQAWLERVRREIRSTSGPAAASELTSVSEADGSEMTRDAVFREVVQPERLARGPGRAGRPVVTFTDLGDGRTEMTLPRPPLATRR